MDQDEVVREQIREIEKRIALLKSQIEAIRLVLAQQQQEARNA